MNDTVDGLAAKMNPYRVAIDLGIKDPAFEGEPLAVLDVSQPQMSRLTVYL